jgi:drug/metabolite transporter superfamily protein YnfA
MAGVAILFFNDMLAKASPKNIGMLFISMTVIQIIIAFLYSIMVNSGELSLYKVLGCVLCIIGIILVNL